MRICCLALFLSLTANGQLAFAQPAATPPTDTPAVPVAKTIAPATQKQRGPIVVALVVDQLAAWALRARLPKLPADGGFARLRREGVYFEEMAFAHAITETGPGHASLFTGKTPREHGIVANDVIGPEGKQQSILADPGAANALLRLDGSPVPRPGSSIAALDEKLELVAASFRSRYPMGKGLLAALSLKDRGSLFAAGRDPDIAIWFDATLGSIGDPGRERGAFVAPKSYAPLVAGSELAEFLRAYRATAKNDPRDGVERLEDQPWQGFDPKWLQANAGLRNAGDYTGFVDLHTAGQALKPGTAFRALPDSDRLLFELALQILKTESKGLPAFVTVSLSANDTIGHLFGPDSWQAWDELYRLDSALAWFCKELDALDPQSWSIVLSADHGVAPLEDEPRRPRCDGNVKAALDSSSPCSGVGSNDARIDAEALVRESEDAAAKAGLVDANGTAVGKVIAGFAHPYLYLTEAAKSAIAGNAKLRARLARRLDAELKKKFKSVQAIIDVAPFQGDSECPTDRADPLRALVCRSISPDPERGGNFYVVTKPGAFFDPDMIKGAGSGHGSPYGYDRIVPLLVRDGSRPELAGKVERARIPFSRFHDELVHIILSAPAR